MSVASLTTGSAGPPPSSRAVRQLALTAVRFRFTVNFTVSQHLEPLACPAVEAVSASYVAFAIPSYLVMWRHGP